MKKITLFTLALSFLLISCSKDETPDPKSTLTGTEWVYVDENGTTSSFNFSSNTECKHIVFISTGGTYVSGQYTYTYSDIEILMTSKSAGMASLKGIISDNEMEISNMSTNKSLGIFVKKIE